MTSLIEQQRVVLPTGESLDPLFAAVSDIPTREFLIDLDRILQEEGTPISAGVLASIIHDEFPFYGEPYNVPGQVLRVVKRDNAIPFVSIEHGRRLIPGFERDGAFFFGLLCMVRGRCFPAQMIYGLEEIEEKARELAGDTFFEQDKRLELSEEGAISEPELVDIPERTHRLIPGQYQKVAQGVDVEEKDAEPTVGNIPHHVVFQRPEARLTEPSVIVARMNGHEEADGKGAGPVEQSFPTAVIGMLIDGPMGRGRVIKIERENGDEMAVIHLWGSTYHTVPTKKIDGVRFRLV